MAKKKTPNNNKIPDLKPKFNINWVYGIVAVIFISSLLFRGGDLTTKNVSNKEFETILQSNDVSKIVIVNKTIAQVFIKKELSEDLTLALLSPINNFLPYIGLFIYPPLIILAIQ